MTQKAIFFFFFRKKQENAANVQRSSTKTMWLLEKLSPVLPDFPIFICRVATCPSKRDSCHEPFKAPGLHRSQTHEKSLCPRDFPGKNTKVGGHFLLQVIFPWRRSRRPCRNTTDGCSCASSAFERPNRRTKWICLF